MLTGLSDPESLGPLPSITQSRTDAFLVGVVIVIGCALGGRADMIPFKLKICAAVVGLLYCIK